MNTQKIAILKGVPMPETSMKLDWQGETNFYWHKPKIEDPFFEWQLSYGRPDVFNDFVDNNCVEIDIIPAPQMHEIAPMLPEKIKNEKEGVLRFGMSHIAISYIVFYDNFPKETIRIKNNHYAEACAELYLKLKNEGILSK